MSSSFSQQVRLGVIWSLIQNWGLRLGGLVVFMVLARILSPSEMGLFAAATTVIAFCALFVDSGLSEAVVQTRDITPRQLSSVFVLNLVTALALVLGLWASASWLAAYFKLPDLVWILRISCLSILFSAFTFSQMAMFRRAFAYKRLASVTLGATFVAGAVAIVMALQGGGVWSLVAQTLLSAVYTAGMLWWRPQWKLTWGFEWATVKGLTAYGLQRLLTSLMDFANTRFIELFFAATYGAATLGLYVVGARIYQSLMQVLCSAILDIAHNAFSRLADDVERMREAYYMSVGLAAASSMPVFMLLAAVPHELTLTVFGPKWGQAQFVVLPLLLLGGIQVLQFFNGVLANAMGRPGIGVALAVGKTVATMGTLYLSRELPFQQMIWAYFGSQLVMTPASFWMARKVVNVSTGRVVKRVAPFLLAVAAGHLVVFLVRPFLAGMPVAIQLICLLSVAGMTYLSVAVLIAKPMLIELLAAFRNRHQRV
jgi:O-antigen/teichoic acid export membrane protein